MSTLIHEQSACLAVICASQASEGHVHAGTGSDGVLLSYSTGAACQNVREREVHCNKYVMYIVKPVRAHIDVLPCRPAVDAFHVEVAGDAVADGTQSRQLELYKQRVLQAAIVLVPLLHCQPGRLKLHSLLHNRTSHRRSGLQLHSKRRQHAWPQSQSLDRNISYQATAASMAARLGAVEQSESVHRLPFQSSCKGEAVATYPLMRGHVCNGNVCQLQQLDHKVQLIQSCMLGLHVILGLIQVLQGGHRGPSLSKHDL